MKILIPAVTALALMVGTAQAAKSTPRIATALLEQLQTDQDQFDVLVYFDSGRDQLKSVDGNREERLARVFEIMTQASQTAQASLIAKLKAKKIAHKSYYIGNLVAVFAVDRTTLAEIIADDSIARIRLNPWVKQVDATPIVFEPADGNFAAGENVMRTGADKVWKEFEVRGEGIIVGNQDTGIDWDHPGLINQYRGWDGKAAKHDYNWHDSISGSGSNPCGYETTEPCDDNGHGTHTLGTSLGDDGQGNQVGLAPKAKWIACRNMDAGAGRPSTYIECFQYFLAPWPKGGDPIKEGKVELAAHVMNNSWGCPASEGCQGDEFMPVLETLHAAGIMVVAAAGNAGSNCETINDGPAHHTKHVFSVGAVDHRNDNIASFSSRGPSAFDAGIGPDISAPGVSIRSTVKGGGYSSFFWSGTSMASPHVVGAVALLWSGHSELIGKVEATAELLRANADAKTSSQTCGGVEGSKVPNNTFGSGILNVYKAYSAKR